VIDRVLTWIITSGESDSVAATADQATAHPNRDSTERHKTNGAHRPSLVVAGLILFPPMPMDRRGFRIGSARWPYKRLLCIFLLPVYNLPLRLSIRQVATRGCLGVLCSGPRQRLHALLVQRTLEFGLTEAPIVLTTSTPVEVSAKMSHSAFERMGSSSNFGPNFLCIGLQKAGTAWLYDQLEMHPDFVMPPLKELHYFDKRLKVKRLDNLLHRMQSEPVGLNLVRARQGKRPYGERDLEFLVRAQAIRGAPIDIEKYADLFQSKSNLMTGDITPGYSRLTEQVIHEISQRFPAIKIILLLRDPIDRSWSQLNMHIRKRKFAEEAAGDWSQVKSNLSRKGMSERSYPSGVWKRWIQFFPPERIRYYFFDDLCREPAGFRASILEFLGADPGKASGTLSADHNRKTNLRKVSMTPSIREHMIEFFQEELLACAQTFGGPAKQWLARYGIDQLEYRAAAE
jgi:hypothetical protein